VELYIRVANWELVIAAPFLQVWSKLSGCALNVICTKNVHSERGFDRVKVYSDGEMM